jgi:archaellum component FlaG (FlaF/FlaG flagellin family)
VVLVYQAKANAYADPGIGGTIENTVTITGDGLSGPVTASALVSALAAPMLTIAKSITPAQVVDNDRVTYTFVIQNTGSEAVVATDNAAITDVFDPILTALTVTFNGAPWTQGVQYNYNEATGLFTTVPGQILVPGATYTQDPVTGAYSATPGIATLMVTGTI